MSGKRLFFYAALIFSLLLADAKSNVLLAQSLKNTSEEDRLTDKLFELKEIKKLDKELKKYKANASFMTRETPSVQSPYYEISVGYNGPWHYETRYWFRIKNSYVNKEDIRPYLEVLDVVSGNYISLAKFRKAHRN
ncbi:hypothetical protein SAMN05192574_11622 [Mucilaginibacter gossypiicola]|uniref:Uncharacterized protein n=1 Tax=Mucilaginibacter gossypiicola TaxID=551995 RepID=A0A1H8TKV0_9SPHI|nr:hypothetical protein [Mucilaginibacter gossypiicola]SEO91416.1 hypothetical protein SAMN05192574_11622 [Mucilaginibacter gossypiicola]